ncbi:coproporphyrinogen III oxidase [Haematobacter missouriensis]|uniref:Heme chaperone HemW n=1 Tax=Haematobacter missouriensis TaxID=366616 RepID=A0A212AM12_9RHOB|nr:radical SAM family heme chaperone HemW [Haematobacter missouriensis]KFI32896.1 coproporphyrinogen III oxidase [Haematobacter missouriensis]OWJ73135.1 coproporphyrinogen III oxidase [Haematobacter missouriensis]OWJ82548.1 coproporphyrinogen III oxidase [Haematobacter missouriensis]
MSFTASEDWRNAGFGLYVHWPFCQAKCPYCDFNSHVAREVDQKRWLAAYESEIRRLSQDAPGRVLNTVFFGGGTPSLMAPETVAGVLEAARSAWPFANDIEITLEANPTSVEADRFRAYREAGVNRLSMGIQSLNDEHLRRLGRLHTVSEARKAFTIARDTFDKVSFDLIYARQDQGLPEWQAELGEALSMAIDHLSLYQLTIEDGTAFGARHAAGGLRGLPDDDLSADLYAATQDTCASAGLPGYEISNHAAEEAKSQHNLIYWRYGDYAGVGPGAHGRLSNQAGRFATDTPLQPGAWLEKVERHGNGEASRTPLPAEEQAAEYLMMSLRLTEGMDSLRYEKLMGKPLDEAAILSLEDLGLLERRDDRLRATVQGRMVLNGIIRDLLPG